MGEELNADILRRVGQNYAWRHDAGSREPHTVAINQTKAIIDVLMEEINLLRTEADDLRTRVRDLEYR